MTERWTVEQAKQWSANQPWGCGANFYPSNAINQLEMFQADTFDLATMDRELGWAAAVGMNLMRVYLHDLLWEQDADGFCRRLDEYLALAEKHGIRTLLTIFDDCWDPNPQLGPQRAPKPKVHNSGWMQSPGKAIVNDPQRKQWGRLEKYVTGIVSRFGKDPRVFGWDVYNEPGNGPATGVEDHEDQQYGRSLPLLEKVYEWARAADPTTPLTNCIWQWKPQFDALNEFTMANCDIASFHCYAAVTELRHRIDWMVERSEGRRIVCTEYLARGLGSTFEHCLPVLRKYDIDAINWGLVSGKTNTIYPWGWSEDKGEPEIYHHDVFNADGTFLCPPEEDAIRRVTGA